MPGSQRARSPVDELVVEALGRFEDGGKAAVGEFLGQLRQHAQEVRERLETLGEVGLVDALPGGTSDGTPERLGEFRLLERIGHGGMGVVYRAIQEPLGREVALKVIRPDQLFFHGARERFRREVETVAKLQHPGIVAVHSVGEQDGVPYFAMELVRGRSLGDLLAELEGRDPATLTGRDLDPTGNARGYLFEGSWEETALRVIRQVCDALAFAHEGGVLHRDIKPSNVMITSEGATRVLLLDFGLAAHRGSDSLTRTGSQVGTLRYMAREQLRGDTARIGPRTDVYGLGLTLYELLANGPAFSGRSDLDLLMAIESGDLPPLRSRNPAVSWEAETICATAADPDPRRRYAGPADLARDLANALERRPIEARPAGTLLRARRWAQRRPAAATASAMGLLVLVGGPAAYTWQQHRAGILLAAERDTATRLAGLTLEAMDRILTRLGAEELRLVPLVEPIRRAALEDAVELLERLLVERRDDPRTAEEAADAHGRLGRLLAELGRNTEAVEAIEAGVLLLEELALERPGDEALAEKIISQRLRLALVLGAAGRLEESRTRLGKLDEELGDRLERDEGNLELARMRVSARVKLGSVLRDLDELQPSREVLEQAAMAADALLVAHPDQASLVDVSADAWNQYGLLLLTKPELGADEPELFAALERSLEVAEQLTSLVPEPRNQVREASALNNLSGAHRRYARHDESRVYCERGLEILEPLVRDFPSTLAYKLELATVRNQLGISHEYVSIAYREAGDMERSLDKLAESEPHYEETIRLLSELTIAAPEEFQLHHRLAIARINLANVRFKVHADRPGWGALIEGSVAAAARARELAPDHADVAATLFNARIRLTNVLLGRGEVERAAGVADEMPGGLATDVWRGHSQAALVHARCVEKTRSEIGLADTDRDRAIAEYAARACEHLRAAIEGGMPDVDRLGVRSDLAALRGSEAFEELLLELESD